MRGAGPVGWGRELVYGYYTADAGITRLRISVDEADHLGVVEGRRVALALPGMEPVDGLVVRVRREPPFVWVEVTPLAPAAANRAG